MQNDFNRIHSMIKEIAVTAVENTKPLTMLIGVVTSDAPLAIMLDSQLVIPESRIMLTKNTCEWTMEMSVDHVTENRAGGGGQAEYASHNHEYKGRKKYLVHNQLKKGDLVWLLQETGGQRYIAIDRVYNPNEGCTTK